MQALANLIISVIELAEAEGRAAHRGVIRLLTRALLIVIAGILLLAGIGWLGWGIYLVLHRWTGPIGAAFIYGLFLCLSAGLLWGYGKRLPPASASQRASTVSTPNSSNAPETSPPQNGSDSDSSKRPEQGNPHESAYAQASQP